MMGSRMAIAARRYSLVALSSLALAGCSASHELPENDELKIVRSTLIYIAREFPFNDETLCLDPLLVGAGIDRWRETLDIFRSISDDPAIDLAYQGKGIGWYYPEIENDRYLPDRGGLEAKLANPLSRILAREPGHLPVLQRVPERIVPSQLVMKAEAVPNSPDCSSVVSMNYPSIEGDTAFLETGYHCGPLCGEGKILALRRSASGWHVVAWARTWVS